MLCATLSVAAPLASPSLIEQLLSEEPYMVVLHNDDHTPMERVVAALIRATRCDAEEAEIEMWEAHTFGKASVHFAGEQECREAADVLGRAGLKAEVVREWPE